MKSTICLGSPSQTTAAKGIETKLTVDTIAEAVKKLKDYSPYVPGDLNARQKEVFNMMMDSMALNLHPFVLVKSRNMGKSWCEERTNRIFNIGIDFGRAEEKKTMGYREGYDEGTETCTEDRAVTRVQKMHPNIEALVNYAERTGSAETAHRIALDAKYDSERKIRELTNELANTKQKLDNYTQAYEEVQCERRKLGLIIDEYREKEYRAKQLVAKKRATERKKAKKTVARKAK